jgi:hypothetical protein
LQIQPVNCCRFGGESPQPLTDFWVPHRGPRLGLELADDFLYTLIAPEISPFDPTRTLQSVA